MYIPIAKMKAVIYCLFNVIPVLPLSRDVAVQNAWILSICRQNDKKRSVRVSIKGKTYLISLKSGYDQD
jgi:hypothetical protein